MGDVPHQIAQRYLAHLKDGPDTLILGCTHYPLLKGVIGDVLPGVQLVDSACATADALAIRLEKMGLLRNGTLGTQTFLVTDNVDRFRRTGSHFLERQPEPVELADLEAQDEVAFTHLEPGLKGA